MVPLALPGLTTEGLSRFFAGIVTGVWRHFTYLVTSLGPILRTRRPLKNSPSGLSLFSTSFESRFFVVV
jgi:hypothetical protein